MNEFKEYHKQIIFKSCGIINGDFVTKPGIMITQETKQTNEAVVSRLTSSRT